MTRAERRKNPDYRIAELETELERLREENETLKNMLYTWVTPVELAEALEKEA